MNMKAFIKWFKLKDADGYKFDLSDISCIIYVICVVGIILGFNMTPLFLGGCIVSLIASIPARRINLIIINLAMICLNLFYLIVG